MITTTTAVATMSHQSMKQKRSDDELFEREWKENGVPILPQEWMQPGIRPTSKKEMVYPSTASLILEMVP